MTKIDFKKELKHLYKPSAKKVEVVDVPQMNFLMIDGEGDPNISQEFQDAVETLYSLSYTSKRYQESCSRKVENDYSATNEIKV